MTALYMAFRRFDWIVLATFFGAFWFCIAFWRLAFIAAEFIIEGLSR